jgi:hypothetical protein
MKVSRRGAEGEKENSLVPAIVRFDVECTLRPLSHEVHKEHEVISDCPVEDIDTGYFVLFVIFVVISSALSAPLREKVYCFGQRLTLHGDQRESMPGE